MIYNVNYRVFDMFFALCIRLFICLFTYYFIVTSGTHPRYRKNMIALNYWLSCTYLILGISKIVLLIGSSYNHGDKFVRYIVAIITIIPTYFEMKYSNSMYSIIIEIFEDVPGVHTRIAIHVFVDVAMGHKINVVLLEHRLYQNTELGHFLGSDRNELEWYTHIESVILFGENTVLPLNAEGTLDAGHPPPLDCMDLPL